MKNRSSSAIMAEKSQGNTSMKNTEAAMTPVPGQTRRFPTSAGVFLGLGLGGFFDGIVLHQILQWHHMATSAGYPADSVENLKFNTLLDGLFHAATYVFVVIGLASCA